MKTEPYIKVTNSNGSEGFVKSFTCVPEKGAKLIFECDRDGRNLFARGIAAEGSFGCLLTEQNELVQILSLKASSVSEFWLKAHAAGCVFEEDDTAPKEPEKEISRLKDRIETLEEKVRKYKDTVRLICAKSENI